MLCCQCSVACSRAALHRCQHTMRFGSTAKVLLKCKLKYYRISECSMTSWPSMQPPVETYRSNQVSLETNMHRAAVSNVWCDAATSTSCCWYHPGITSYTHPCCQPWPQEPSSSAPLWSLSGKYWGRRWDFERPPSEGVVAVVTACHARLKAKCPRLFNHVFCEICWGPVIELASHPSRKINSVLLQEYELSP